MGSQPVPTASSPTGEGVLLSELLDRLPALLKVAVAPGGLDLPAGEPVILDPTEPLPEAPALLLAVGVDSPRALIALIDRLRETGLSTVALKHVDPDAADIVAAATDNQITLLRAPDELPWGRLHSLLITALQPGPAAADRLGAPLGDLFALANAIAVMVGGATTIEDPHSTVLAYSSLDHPIDEGRRATILGRQVPEMWLDRLQSTGALRRLWHTDGVIRIDFDDLPGYRSRLAVGVRAGGELLGSIWVIEGDVRFDADAERSLQEAASIAALHLIRHHSQHDVDRQRRADALLDLLDGRDRGDRAQSVFRLDPAELAAVIAFDIGTGDAAGRLAAARVADLVAMHCEAYRRTAVCAARGPRVYAMVPVSAAASTGAGSEGASESLRQLAAAIVARASSTLRLDIVAGIGSPVVGLAGLAGSRREADQVVDVLRRQSGAQPNVVADINQVRAKAVLRRLSELAVENPDLREGRLDALVAQDASRSTNWVDTLRAYFDAFGDMGIAAAAVNVHPNTFRYRLRRIVEVFGIDLDDPDERLVAELQLRFLGSDPGSGPAS